jgi:vacuolar-type H+-ATPase subunit H
MKKAYVGLFILLVALLNVAVAQKPAVMMSDEPGWHKIGEITANFKMQTESIVVLGADKFSSVKLRVTDAPMNIDRIQVVYESGEVEDIEVRNNLKEGGETRTVSLKNADEDIEKVVFTYKTLENYKGEKAHVELYGFKGDRDQSDAYRDKKREKENDAEDAEREAREEANEIKRDAEREADKIDNDADNADDEAVRKAKAADREVKDDGEKLGDKISEGAGNVAAEVKDKPYSNKMGPDGEKVFIDKNSKYYYINHEGKKVYISKSQLRDKPEKDN